MSDEGYGVRPAWSDRPHEEAHLLNPAFVGMLLCRMVADYARKAGRPMPIALAFLLVPIVLHRRTREALPKSTVTGVLSWLQEHKDVHVTFPGRMRVTRAVTQEALMFAMAHAYLAVDGSALAVGRRRIPASYPKDANHTDETRECVDRAAFVGRWLAGAGTDHTIFAAWGSGTMTFQIANIILYSHDGRIRELPFRIGELNVITGSSKTGKSALIDIVDYYTGRGDCYVAEGVIRRHVSWFAVLFQAGDSQIFVARRNPGPGNKTSPDIYVQRGTTIEPPDISALAKNFTLDALGKMLDAAVGINENQHRPPAGQTRDPLTANIRHALTFSFQDQDEIDSKKILFHRTGDNFIAQAVKDSLPYFLGAIDEDRLLKLSLLDAAKRELQRLERQLREISNASSDELIEARALLEEAQSVGLVDERVAASTREAVIGTLALLAGADFVGSADDALARLRTERAKLRNELEEVKSELRATRLFRTENGSYRREAGEQRARLSAIGLFRDGEADHAHCPLCESALETPLPAVEEIVGALAGMHQELQAVETESPKIQAKLASLQERETGLEGRLRENGQRMAARIRENEFLAKQRDDFVVQARTVGKITQYLSTSARSADNSALVRQVEEARARVTMLAAEVGDDSAQERLETYLNIIGRTMTDYSGELDLEHRGSQLRLDIRKLTVIADTIDGPVPLQRMGSGENWVGYHVLTHLALHKWFRQKSRPVPGFLILDQPSQAHYPPEKDADDGSIASLADEDKTAVQKLFLLIAKVAGEIAPSLQVILLDHADLNDDWFDAAVIERWRHGRKLVPLDWIDS